MKSEDKGIKRLLKAFVYSKQGFLAAYKSEEAFRLDILFCVIMLGLSFFLPCSVGNRAYLTSSLIILLLMELVNTAIETIVDLVTKEYNELAKKAKDIGSLLVLLAFVNVGMIWGAFLYGWLVK